LDQNKPIVPIDRIENKILLIRNERVIVDADLASFFGVPTKRLNEQVRRNQGRFPKDFVFQLTTDEFQELVANCDHLSKLKYSRVLPYVFTEHGSIMAANVLSSDRAVDMGVYVVRAFVNLRRNVETHKEISTKLEELEIRLMNHDEQLKTIVRAVKTLINKGKGDSPRRRIGFDARKK